MSPSKKKGNFKHPKNRSTKIHLVFDEAKRREFLTGFHKRKLERKRLAKEKLDKDLKEERKRLKQEAKKSYKNLVVSHRAIPEVEHLLEDQYQDGEVKVSIVDFSSATKDTWIGTNAPKYSDSEDDPAEADDAESEEEMPGMELKPRMKPCSNLPPVAPKFRTEKEIKLALKKQATKNVKKSKVFQMHNKLEKQKQKKKSMKERRKREKIQAKNRKLGAKNRTNRN